MKLPGYTFKADKPLDNPPQTCSGISTVQTKRFIKNEVRKENIKSVGLGFMPRLETFDEVEYFLYEVFL